MADDAARLIAGARAAQPAWAATSVRERLKVLGQARQLFCKHAAALADSLGERSGRTRADSLMAEVVTLADACKFLEREAPALLAPKKLGSRGRPPLFSGVRSEIHRVPLGVVLVIGPSNYPLFLPGVQALQALAAGNACVLKPGVTGGPVARHFAKLLAEAGLDTRLLPVLGEEPEAAQAAITAGVDKVVLTGSAGTGAKVLAALAPSLTPATMELSGCDAVFVLPGANLELAVRALRWALKLNAGATCIGPRRVFVTSELAGELERRLTAALLPLPPVKVAEPVCAKVCELAGEALNAGARLAAPASLAGQRTDAFKPILLADVAPQAAIAQADLFAPVLSMLPVKDMNEALRAHAQCPYALGAAVFGPEAQAFALAKNISAGSVTINDIIAPTADPRLPFGGRGRSGFGATRGAEGLLELTAVKTLSVRSGTFRPHYDDPRPGDEELFLTYLRALHGASWTERAGAAAAVVRRLMQRK